MEQKRHSWWCFFKVNQYSGHWKENQAWGNCKDRLRKDQTTEGQVPPRGFRQNEVALLLMNKRQLGKGIKGDYLFTSPSCWCGLHLWVPPEKKIKKKEHWLWGGSVGSAGTDVTKEWPSDTGFALGWGVRWQRYRGLLSLSLPGG